MSFSERLRSMGTRLGLVQPSPPAAPGAMPVKIATRAITFQELTSEIRGDHVIALAPTADVDAGLDVPFGAIDEAAGLRPPAHGWTADKVAAEARRMAQATASRDEMQEVLLALLAKAGATSEDVVRDALARDRALDTYADAARQALAERVARRRRRCAEIAVQMERYRQEMAELDRQDAADRDRWQTWWTTKLAREETLAAAVDALLDQPVVTVDRETPPIG